MFQALRKVSLGALAVAVAGAGITMAGTVPTFAASSRATPASSLVLNLPAASAYAQGHMQPDPVYFYDPEDPDA